MVGGRTRTEKKTRESEEVFSIKKLTQLEKMNNSILGYSCQSHYNDIRSKSDLIFVSLNLLQIWVKRAKSSVQSPEALLMNTKIERQPTAE